MKIEEITAQIADLNPEDRVFKAGDHIIKVKTLHDDTHSSTGQEIYRFSGSVCGPDGKALKRPDGGLHVHNLGHTCTVQLQHVLDPDGGDTTYAVADLAEHLKSSTLICIHETVQAMRSFETRHTARGVGSLSAFRARTGAETRH